MLRRNQNNMTTVWPTIIFFLISFNLAAMGQAPFTVAAALDVSNTGETLLSVSFSMPNHHYLYGDRIKVEAPHHVKLLPKKIPPTTDKRDELSGTTIAVYAQNTTLIYAITGKPDYPLNINVTYQGCDETMCFLPETKTFVLAPGMSTGPAFKKPQSNPTPGTRTAANALDWRQHFNLIGRTVGYLRAEKFIKFLDDTHAGQSPARNNLYDLFEKNHIWLVLALILLGGFALNLTPCVLPMIPINIAIIGAGAKAASRAHGFALGSAYGMGITVAYGALGLFAILTGAQFGALNLSPVFNAVAAVVFMLLALAMFGVFTVNLSGFQRGGIAPGIGKYPAAFLLGAFTALLAGACVAPVLISVLLLSSDLWAQHNPLGLILPFVLGAGMALPWPFAGAGLSFLPKPGKWMVYIKYAFGLIILGFACYYASLAYKLFTWKKPSDTPPATKAHDDTLWHISLPLALAKARQENKPVFIDFIAPGCKSCIAMEKTTFKDPLVRKRLEEYVRVKLDAGNLENPAVQAALDDFGVKGFPTYIVLVPKELSRN